jgi:DNA transposition AAA+ family ATPase
MKNAFVKTGNVRRYYQALSALEDRGAAEACLIVVDGKPGLGKTTTLRNWVAQTGSVYVRAKKEWTSRWFLDELLEAMNITPPYSFKLKFKEALKALVTQRHNLALQGGSFGIVIDEADHIAGKEMILDTVRDLTDNLELPAVLVGMDKINTKLKRYPQISSRVSQRVHFTCATKEDVRQLIDERCEVRVADDLVDFVLKVTGGYNREILEAIARIERFGLISTPGPDGVTLRDMAGQVIIDDRDTSKPVLVPRVV